MFCTKCGTQYPDNGSCPNCEPAESLFKTAGSLDDSMDMDTASAQPQTCVEPQPEPQPQAYAEPQQQAYAQATPNIDEPTYNPNAGTTSYNSQPVNNPYAAIPPYAGAPAYAKPSYAAQIIMSICIFISAFVLPVISFWGESITFGDILEVFMEAPDAVLETPIGIWFVAFIVVSVLLFIFSCVKSKIMCILSSIAGIIVMLIPIFYFVEEAGSEFIEVLFDFDIIGIGYWVPLILFVVHLITSSAKRN